MWKFFVELSVSYFIFFVYIYELFQSEETLFSEFQLKIIYIFTIIV